MSVTGETDLSTLIKSMKPSLNEGNYVFCTVPSSSPDINPNDIICLFRESVF